MEKELKCKGIHSEGFCHTNNISAKECDFNRLTIRRKHFCLESRDDKGIALQHFLDYNHWWTIITRISPSESLKGLQSFSGRPLNTLKEEYIPKRSWILEASECPQMLYPYIFYNIDNPDDTILYFSKYDLSSGKMQNDCYRAMYFDRPMKYPSLGKMISKQSEFGYIYESKIHIGDIYRQFQNEMNEMEMFEVFEGMNEQEFLVWFKRTVKPILDEMLSGVLSTLSDNVVNTIIRSMRNRWQEEMEE